ncbi:Rieske (2Fe-2S) protein, partial [Candidatus Uhrbacteria bacterium]|nr:Rieske (2Fe-2S) protein [Candidatus Uhrbacteria bacterium]
MNLALSRKIPIARINEIPVGRTKSFRFGVTNGIAYNDGGEIKAYVNRCTHMGGPVELDQKSATFKCRWHESAFDPKTGNAIEGEAPQGTQLKPIELVTEGEQIFAVLELPK